MNSQDCQLDRAAAQRTDLDFLEAKLGDPNTLLLPLWKGQLFVEGDALCMPSVCAAADLVDKSGEIIWLGFVAGAPCFAVDLTPMAAPLAHAALSGTQLSELRPLLGRLPSASTQLAFYARALVNWHERHQFCATCGQPSRPRQGGHLRVCSAQACGAQHFPRTDPCVLVLVRDGDRCLLGRSRGWPAGMYSALAGFVEAGESLEQGAAREVFEEAGVDISDLQYFGSEPWPFPSSLMIGFVANARNTEIRVDHNELEAAKWVTRAELKATRRGEFFVPPPEVSLSGRLIAAFADGRI